MKKEKKNEKELYDRYILLYMDRLIDNKIISFREFPNLLDIHNVDEYMK